MLIQGDKTLQTFFLVRTLLFFLCYWWEVFSSLGWELVSPSKDAQRGELSTHCPVVVCIKPREGTQRKQCPELSGCAPTQLPPCQRVSCSSFMCALFSPTAILEGSTTQTWPRGHKCKHSDGALTGLRFKPFFGRFHGSQVLLLSHISFNRLVRNIFLAEPWKCWQLALSHPRDSVLRG